MSVENSLSTDAFQTRSVATSTGHISFKIGGRGSPLVLLHGFPQTHLEWRKIAPALAKQHTLILPDLRGYGSSAAPPSSSDHAPYSKRAMAADICELMDSLGFDRFDLVGHDRGARVAHRLALDVPDRVGRLALLDIIPTLAVYELMDALVSQAYWHWSFLARPYPFPEHLIGANPQFVLTHLFGPQRESFLSADVFKHYLQAFERPDYIHAFCEDYRAGATIDLLHDRETFKAGKRLTMPTLILYGSQGLLEKAYDVKAVWSQYSADLTVQALQCGHFLPEEAPQDTLKALTRFLNGSQP